MHLRHRMPYLIYVEYLAKVANPNKGNFPSRRIVLTRNSELTNTTETSFLEGQSRDSRRRWEIGLNKYNNRLEVHRLFVDRKDFEMK